jgi:squalene-associated FAD-dependent desaturase
LIVGGGPAGLAAALRLSTRGATVTLIEQHRQLGGRLVTRQVEAVPPVLMGHHTATLALLDELRVAGRTPLRPELRFEFLLPGGRIVPLMQPWLPAPLHMLAGLLLFGGLPIKDRWRLMDMIERSWEGDPALPQNLDQRTAEDWLTERGQSERARADVWTPLARFLLGDDLATVSAGAFVAACTRCFLASRRNARLAVPTDSLQNLLLKPLADALAKAGATVRTNTNAVLLQVEGERISGVRLSDGSTLMADAYLLALPHRHLTAILPERILTHYAYFQQLTQLSDSPVLTVHLWVDQALQAPRVVLPARRIFHWLVSRPWQDRGRTVVSVAITGSTTLFGRTDQELVDLAMGELAYAYPGSDELKVLGSRVVRESQAFLTMKPGARIHRPLPQGPFRNLYIGGDWTDTGLPANLESAITSGNRCADLILAEKG